MYLIVFKILFFCLIVIGLLMLVVVVFCILPISYKISFKYSNFNVTINCNFFICMFELQCGIKKLLAYKFEILNLKIIDSDKISKNKKVRKNKISEDSKEGFIKYKNIINEVNDNDKNVIKNLWLNAKKYGNKNSNDNSHNNSHNNRNDSYIHFLKKKFLKSGSGKAISSVNVKKSIFSKLKKFQICNLKNGIKEEIDLLTDNILIYINNYIPKKIIMVIKIVLKAFKPYYKRYLPKKIIFNIGIGMDDFYLKGIIMSLLAPLYVKMGDNLKIKKNFDEKGINLYLNIVGSIQLIFAIIPVVKLLLHKPSIKAMIENTNI